METTQVAESLNAESHPPEDFEIDNNLYVVLIYHPKYPDYISVGAPKNYTNIPNASISVIAPMVGREVLRLDFSIMRIDLVQIITNR